MTDGSRGAASACWNCRQPLQAGLVRCIWCGVPQGDAAPPLVVAPGPTVLGAPVFGSPVAGSPAGGAAVGGAAFAIRPRAVTPFGDGLPPEFHGSIAGAGARVVAFSVDIVLVGVAVGTAFALSLSAAVTVAVLLEILLVLWILDARTGATPGMALLRLRTSRADRPASPGAAASLARAITHGAGFLVAGVGAWVVAASSAFDSARRGWADRLTHTVVVAVPARQRLPQAQMAALAAPASPHVVPLSHPAAGAPTLAPPPIAPVSAVLAEPRIVSLTPPRSPIDDDSESSARTGPPESLGAVPQVSEAPIVGDASGGAIEVDGSVLLVFDTGQRERFAAPVAINLGRKPTASQVGDKLVTVNDPESTVSKTHARLDHSRGTTWITDAGSTNGTEMHLRRGSRYNARATGADSSGRRGTRAPRQARLHGECRRGGDAS